MTRPRIKVAFGSVPKDGGTYTFYRNMRPALARLGIDLFCVTIGRPQNRLWDDAYADAGCVRLVPRSLSLKAQARAFVNWVEAEQIDIVIAINSEGILSSLAHLPQRVRVVSRCANAFDFGYKVTMAGRDRLARIVALTPRLRDDLVADYGADAGKIVLIPNGVDAAPYEGPAARVRGQSGKLELGFLGRLEHGQKGVMYLPAIVRELNARGVDFRLRIAGKGEDRPRLERELAEELRSGQVELMGALTPDQVPTFLGESDIYLFTSHFEGCPNALLEAMMAGCVPVSGIIDGITDFLVEPGRTGYLCKLGDAEAFADAVAGLNANRAHLAAMSEEVAQEARARFTNEIAAQSYRDVFEEVMQDRPPAWTPALWSQFVPDPNFSTYWTNRIPPGLKGWLKKVAR